MTEPKENVVYPVDIYMKPSLRIVCAAFFGTLILICVVVGLFSLADSQSRGTLLAMGACLLVFAPLLWMTLASKLSLWPDRLESFSGFWRSVLLRSDIEGYRWIDGNMRLDAKGSLWRGMTLSSNVYRNPHVIAWLGDIPDLDAVRKRAAEDAMEADAGLGATVEERRSVIKSLRKFGATLEGIGILGSLWAVFYPHPYLAAVATAASLPLLAFAGQAVLGWRYNLGRAGTDPRPDMSTLYLMGPLALFVRAMLDVDLIDWQVALGVSFLLGAMLIVLGAMFSSEVRQLKWGLLVVLPIAIAYAYGVVVEANTQFDPAAPSVYPVTVRGKSTSGDGPTSYLLDVSAWGADKLSGDVRVARAFYHDAKIGGRVCIYEWPGLLHLRWYAAAAC